jgi:carboxymethylenebutenolidase
MSVTTQWIDIPSGSEHFSGYLALPKGGKGPGVVIIQEIFGVNEHIRDVAEQYASDGYVALAPDLFWRIQPRTELGYDGEDWKKAVALRQQTDVKLCIADIAATAAILRERAECTGQVAAIGYCFGGLLAYLAAANDLVDVAVPYYGGGIQNALDVAAKVDVPIQFHFAGLDAHIPQAAVNDVHMHFANRDDAQVHQYPGAEHGFNCTLRASYNQHASALAHGRTLQFLAQYLDLSA